MTYQELLPLLQWKAQSLEQPTPEALREALNTQPWETVPGEMSARMVGFRRRKQEERLLVCERFFRRTSTSVQPPKSALRRRVMQIAREIVQLEAEESETQRRLQVLQAELCRLLPDS